MMARPGNVKREMRIAEAPNSECRSPNSLWSDQAGATMIEYVLLVAAIAIPMYYAFRVALDTLMGHYEMWTFLNGWPFP